MNTPGNMRQRGPMRLQEANKVFESMGFNITFDEGMYRQLQLDGQDVGPRMNCTQLCKAAALIQAAGLHR